MSMRPIHMNVALFERPTSKAELDRSRLTLLSLAQCLVQCNEIWLTYHPHTPRIYETDVRYHVEEETDDHFAEEWCDIPTVIRQGWGDCDDLACAICAEYRVHDGIDANPMIKWARRDGSFIYHMLVLLPDGTQEDPSKRLGMGDSVSTSPLVGFEESIRRRRKANMNGTGMRRVRRIVP
jgi:hypothetical protein